MKTKTTGYVGQAARPPGQGPANACALRLTPMGSCRTGGPFSSQPLPPSLTWCTRRASAMPGSRVDPGLTITSGVVHWLLLAPRSRLVRAGNGDHPPDGHARTTHDGEGICAPSSLPDRLLL